VWNGFLFMALSMCNSFLMYDGFVLRNRVD